MGSVEVVVFDEKLPDDQIILKADGEFKVAGTVQVKLKANKGLIRKIRWVLDPRIPYPHGCGVDSQEAEMIHRKVQDSDLVWFFKLRTPNMFLDAAWPRSVVDIDDVPSTFERTALQTQTGMRERVLTLARLFSWRRREKLLGERFTVLAVCSERDSQYLRSLGVKTHTHVIPNGFEKPSIEPVRRPAAPPRIGFIGLFDYFPNREGIQWFVNKCWPRIRRVAPDARLRLVGQGSDGPLTPSGPGLDALGWLANPSDEITTWSAMVVPIRLGAGTRLKIAQGFGQKCPIVSTSLGAYGYGAVDGRELYLADSPEAFADACIRTIRQPEEAARMAERAWDQFLQKWTWDAIRPRIWAAAEDCLQRSGRGNESVAGAALATASSVGC
jgi:glycosyltransferase involved in cell wall biosynthesis